MATTVGMKLALEGESQYKASLQQIQQKSKELASEMKAVVSAGEGEEKQMQVLSAQIKNQQSLIDTLNTKYNKQKSEIENTKKAIEDAKAAYGENSTEVQKLETQLTKQETQLSKTKTQINNETDALNKMEKAADSAGKETDDLGKETEEAGKQAEKGSEGFTIFKGIVANLATDAIKSAVDGLKNLANGIKEAISETAAYGEEVDKSSQKLGVSAETYQQLAYAMDMSGASVEDFKKGMINMNDALNDFANGNEAAGDTYAKLGVSMKKADGRLKTSEELLMDTVDALASMEDVTARDAAAQDIFGKKMTELRPLLNSGSKAIKDLMQEAKDYGMVMSDEAVAASADFDDSMTRLKTTVSGLKRTMMSEFLPSITQVMDGFSKMVAGVDGGQEDLKKGVQNMVKTITSKVPEFLKVGKDIFGSILTGLQQNLPDLVKAVADVIPGIFETIASLVENLDIAGLVKAVFSALNSIITAIVPRLPELLITLINGIIEALPSLFAGVGETIYNIFDKLFMGYSQFDAFKDKIDSQSKAWQGVKDSMASASDQANNDAVTWSNAWEMLKNMTDSSGNVKAGFEGMADVLVNQLNEALGTNITIIDGQIQDYQNLCNEIDNLIEKKRAELILQAEEEAYAEALRMRPELLQAVADAEDQLVAAQNELTAAQRDYDGLVQSGGDLTMAQLRIDNARMSVIDMQNTLDEATANLEENTSLQTQYMDDYTAAMNGDYNKIGRTTKKYAGSTLSDLTNYRKGVESQLAQDQLNFDSWQNELKNNYSANAKAQADYYAKRIAEDQIQIAKINGIIKQGGRDFTQGYVNGILEKEADVTNAGQTVTNDALKAVQNTQQSQSPSKVTQGYGNDFGEGYRLGINEKSASVKSTAESVANQALTGISSKKATARTVGETVGSNFASGVSDKAAAAKNAGSTLAVKAKDGLNSEYYNIYRAGWNTSAGFAAGIGDAGYKVVNAAYATANAAKRKMEQTLEIASPSKVMKRIGGFVTEGLAIGITDKEKLVTDAIGDVAGIVAGDFSLGGVNYRHAVAAIGGHAASNTINRNNTINLTVNGSEGQNVNELADIVINRLQMELIGSEAVYA